MRVAGAHKGVMEEAEGVEKGKAVKEGRGSGRGE
jgi:hypothetical protein